jgi:hypothetical protein
VARRGTGAPPGAGARRTGRRDAPKGVFDFRALQGLAGEPGSGQPQPSSGGQLSLFDSIAPNDPGSAENVIDLPVPVVMTTLHPRICSLTAHPFLPFRMSHFIEHLQGCLDCAAAAAKGTCWRTPLR